MQEVGGRLREAFGAQRVGRAVPRVGEGPAGQPDEPVGFGEGNEPAEAKSNVQAVAGAMADLTFNGGTTGKDDP